MAEKEEVLDPMEQQQEDSSASERNGEGAVAPGEDIAGQGIAGGEVRAVEPPKREGIGPLLLGLLLLVGLIAGGIYLVNGKVTSRTPQLGPDSHKRYSIEPVEEQQMSEPPVATVEASAAQKMRREAAAAKTTVVTPEEDASVAKVATAATAATVEEAPGSANPGAETGPLYRVLVGPYLYVTDTNKAAAALERLGYQGRRIDGKGPVAMVRLLVGSYPPAEARSRLAALKPQLEDAFLLPDGDQLAIYAGSFSDRKRAENYSKLLAKQGLSVTPIVNELEMSGKLFIVAETEQEDARKMTERLTAAGLNARISLVDR